MVAQTNAASKASGGQEVDLFAQMDTNKDGFATPDETEAYFAAQLGGAKAAGSNAKAAGGGAKPANGKATSGEQKPASAQPSAETLFTHLDNNKDGKLSADELNVMAAKANEAAVARGEEPFDFMGQLDVDKDGYIDRTEARAFFKAMGLEGGEKEEL